MGRGSGGGLKRKEGEPRTLDRSTRTRLQLAQHLLDRSFEVLFDNVAVVTLEEALFVQTAQD